MSSRTTPVRSYIVTLDQGWSPKCESNARASSDQWAVLKTTAIQPVTFDETENKQLPAHLEPRPSIEVEVGDVLITRAGPRSRVGITCVVRSTQPRLLLADKIYRLKVKRDIADPVWLAQMLNAPQSLQQLEEMKTGISDSGLNLTQEKFLSLPLPLVSLGVQRRIVAKLDSLRARSARARHELDLVPKLIERYKQAILAKAFSGELTGVRTTTLALSEIAERVTKGQSPRWQGFQYTEAGCLFIRSQNVGWGHLILDDKVYLDPSFNESKPGSVIRENDILLNIVGASIGRSAVATREVTGANCNQAVAIIRLKDAGVIDADYVHWWLLSPNTQALIHDGSVDVARANFSLGNIRQLQIPWPSQEERQNITQALRSTFLWLDKIVIEHARAVHLLPKLDQAILAKAFRGELVPQDPNVEPASVLLERIKAERAATTSVRKFRKV